MSALCRGVFHLLKALFFLFWDGFKAIKSPFTSRKCENDYGDEVCLVTGAAQGLGRQLALAFAERNAVLVLWDIQEEKLRDVAAEIEEMGAKAYMYVCDCSSREEIYRVAALVKEEVGHVSVLVNNAGILHVHDFMDADDEDIEQTFRVNALAHFWTVKAFLPWMLDNNYGYIIQISSIAATSGFPKLPDYCASKAAALAFAESLRSELRVKKKTGISITCVCPSLMDTDMIRGVEPAFPALFPPLKVEFVAERILQAMRDRQFYVALPRQMYTQGLKGILPTRTVDSIHDCLGVSTSLDAVPNRKKTS